MPPSRATAFKSLCSSRWGWSSRNRSKAIFRADSGSEARSDMRIATFVPGVIRQIAWKRSRQIIGKLAAAIVGESWRRLDWPEALGSRWFTQDLRRITVPDGPRNKPDIQSSAWDLIVTPRIQCNNKVKRSSITSNFLLVLLLILAIISITVLIQTIQKHGHITLHSRHGWTLQKSSSYAWP